MCSAASTTSSAVSPPDPMRMPSSVRAIVTVLPGSAPTRRSSAHQLLVLLHLLGDPLHVDALVRRPRGARERLDVVHEVLAADVAQLVEARDRVAVGRLGRVVEQLEEPALDGLRHHVLPAARLGVDELPVEADDVGQQPLGEPVLAHHAGGQELALVGELEVAVALHGEQPVALHPGHGLRHRGARLVQPLGDAGTQRHDALLHELVDRAEVHLGGVDQVTHGGHCVPSGNCERHARRGTVNR